MLIYLYIQLNCVRKYKSVFGLLKTYISVAKKFRCGDIESSFLSFSFIEFIDLAITHKASKLNANKGENLSYFYRGIVSAFVAQRQSTGLVNQGSWVQFPSEAFFFMLATFQ